VTSYFPFATVDATVSVIVVVPDPGAASVDGTKLTVTPLGCPLAVNATAELNPPLIEDVMVVVPEFPMTTTRLVGLAASEKIGAAVTCS
jgi:hypothetical protein